MSVFLFFYFVSFIAFFRGLDGQLAGFLSRNPAWLTLGCGGAGVGFMRGLIETRASL